MDFQPQYPNIPPQCSNNLPQYNNVPLQYPYVQPPQPPVPPVSRRELCRNASRIGLALFLYLIIVTLVQAMIVTVCSNFFQAFYQSEVYVWLVQCVPSYVIGFPFFCLMLIGLPKKCPERRRMGGTNWIGFLAVSFMLMLAGQIIAAVMMQLMESLRGDEITNLISEYIDNSSPLMNLVVTALLAPVIEELMFRKLLIDRLLPYSQAFAVLTSGLLFGLIHGNFYQFFYAALLGGLFALVYVKTGRIGYTIGMHIIINFTGAFISDLLNGLLSETEYTPWDLIAILYQLAMLVLVVCGVILLIRGRKKLKLSTANEHDLPLSKQLKFGWCNAGIITFGVLSALCFLASIFV